MATTAQQKTLLIIWHSRTGAAQQMAQAAQRGAQDVINELEADHSLRIVNQRAADTHADDLLNAHAYLFCAPENLAALSGEMKEFFDRNYYPVLGQLNGRPYALLVSAGSDGEMAVKQAERIAQGWRLVQAHPSLIVNMRAQTPEAILAPKQITPQNQADSAEIGGTLAALLLL